MSAESLGFKPDSVVGAVSQIHTAYRGAEELRKAREAFAARIKRKRLKDRSPEEIESSLQKFLSKAFPEREGYRIQLNWEESEGAEKNTLNSQTPFFLTKDRSLSTEEIVGRNVLQEGWGMWTHYSYEEWYEWYINKPGGIPIGNPIALTLLPLFLRPVYHLPRAVIAIANKITNKYDNGNVVKLENFLTTYKTPLSEMQNTESELHFMRTFLIHDYHEKRINKFAKNVSNRMSEDSSDDKSESYLTQNLFQNGQSMTSPQKIAMLTHRDANTLAEAEEVQSHLKKYKINTRGVIVGVTTAFLAGFFAWPVSLFANTHVVGAVGLTAASAVTGVFVVIGLVAGAIYAYNSYKESKKVNKKIDSLDVDLLLEQQQKISYKIEQTNTNIGKMGARLKKLQNELAEASEKKDVKIYQQKLKQKNQFIQDKHNREEFKQLTTEIEDLRKHQEQLEKLKKEKEDALKIMNLRLIKLNRELKDRPEEKSHKARTALDAAIKKLQDEIESLLPEEIKDTEKLIAQKKERKDKLDYLNQEKNKDNELLYISNELEELEKTEEVKSYLEMIKDEVKIKKEQADAIAKLEKLYDKGRKSQERHHHYQEICQKVAKEKALRQELALLNKAYEDTVNRYAEAKPESCEEIKQTYLSKEMMDPKLESVEHLLRYKQVEKTSIATASALINVKRSIMGPRKEDTPHSVGEAFKGLGKAILDDVWSAGEKLYNYYSAASIPTCVVNIGLLGVAIAGVAASPFLLIGAAAVGVVFLANHFYEEYKQSENAVRDAFLDNPEFSKYTVDQHISCLEKVIEHCKSRNEKTTQLLEAELNKEKNLWSEKSPAAPGSLLAASIFTPTPRGNDPQLSPQVDDAAPLLSRERLESFGG
jgi:hypothetical protein